MQTEFKIAEQSGASENALRVRRQKGMKQTKKGHQAELTVAEHRKPQNLKVQNLKS